MKFYMSLAIVLMIAACGGESSHLDPKAEVGPKPESKAKVEVEVKPEPKAEVKAEVKPEPKAEVKAEIKPEPKPEEKATTMKESLDTKWGKVSYMVGLDFGRSLNRAKFEIDIDVLKPGFESFFAGEKNKLNEEQKKTIRENFDAENKKKRLDMDYKLDEEITKKFFNLYCYEMAEHMKKSELLIEPSLFYSGLEDGLGDAKPKLEEEEMRKVGQEISRERTEKSKKEGQEYLAKKKKEDGVTATASGLLYKVIKEGAGASPTATDRVKVHYAGTLINGIEFDSSYKRGEPASFSLNQVIRGWTEGVQLMKPGAIYEFYIPYELAYGEQGQPGSIPPCATLVFKVELIEILSE